MYKILAVILLLFLFSCKSTVGDSCTESSDCDSSLICEKTFSGGYCLKENCDLNNSESCPEEAQCTYIKEVSRTYCLQKCNENDDCRSNYRCKAIPNHRYRVCLPK